MTAMVSAMVDTLTVETCESGSFHFEHDQKVCEKLLDSQIDQLELEKEKQSMLQIFTSGLSLPDLQQIVNIWNHKMPLAQTPTTVNESSLACLDDSATNCIDNTWFVLAAIDNAYNHEGDVFVPSQGVVHVQFNYTLRAPPNNLPNPIEVCASSIPSTFAIASSNGVEYCGYTFSYQDQTTNNLKRGDLVQDSNKKQLAYAGASQVSTLTANLDVENKITVYPYEWEATGGCECGEFGCRKTVYRCSETGDSYHYSQNLSFSIPLEVTVPLLYQDAYELQIHDATTKPIVTFTTQIPEYILHFGKTTIHKSQFRYRPFYKYPPYNYLWINQSTSPFTLSASTIILGENNETVRFTLLKEQIGSCQLQIVDPLNPYTINCNETQPRTYSAYINATLNQSGYDVGESIGLTVQIRQEQMQQNSQITVEYANQNLEHQLDGDTIKISLDHVENDDQIYIQYQNYSKTISFHSYNSNRYWHFFWFGFSLFVVFIFYKAVSHIMLRRRL